jgi:hypothetical protein
MFQVLIKVLICIFTVIFGSGLILFSISNYNKEKINDSFSARISSITPIDIVTNTEKDNYYYFGKAEGYYPTDTFNFAIWLTRGHPSQGGSIGQFRYDNVPNMQDKLKGDLINNKFELKNSYENPIEIDTISKTGFNNI